MNRFATPLRSSSFSLLVTCLVMGFITTATLRKVYANESEIQATELLPQTVIAYAEIPDLGKTVATVFNHPLRERLLAMPAYAAVLQSDEFSKLKIGVAAFEGTMKQPWQEALQTLSDGGVTVALDSSDGGVALLMKSSDQEALKRFREYLLALRLLTGQSKEQGQYRDINAFSFGDDIKLVFLDHWFLLTNKSELGKAIIDQYLDRGDESLQSNERFRSAMAALQSSKSAQPAMLGYVDLEAIRASGLAKDVFNERVDNFLLEVVFGGVLANLRHTPYATLKLNVETEGVQLQLATPHDRAWEPPREYYFGAPNPASAPPLLDVKDRLFALSSHRDLSQMWLRSGDLLSDNASDQLAKADTQLTTFFSGRDFGEDILGSLESDVQIVGKAQDFTGQLPQPAIKLPAFAIQFRMKDPKTTQPELRRIFQSFVGFLNVIGAMEGQPQFDLGMESVADSRLYTATYVPDVDERESVAAPINFNFSPTIAFAAEYVILSSTIPLARELVELDTKRGGDRPSSFEHQANTAATVDAKTLQQVLQANQTQLVANSMLEKGQSKEDAEAEIGLLLDLVGFLQNSQLSLNVTNSQLQLNLGVNVEKRASSSP